MSLKNFWSRIAGIVFLVVPAFIFYYFTLFHTLNIPFYDEYLAALYWLDEFLKSQNNLNKFLLLFKQANEHRIFTYYISVLSDFIINGTINFHRILILGNLGLIVLAYFIYKHIPVKQNRLLYFAPVSLLLFVFQHEINNWAIVSIGGVWYITFIVMTLDLLNRKSNFSFIAAILMGVLSTFSFGGGFFVFFVGFLILYMNPSKTKIHFLIWLVSMVLSVILFFTGYHFTGGSSATNFLNLPFETIQYGLVFFGSIFSSFYKGHIFLYTLAGFIVLCCTFLLVFLKWDSIKTQTVPLSTMAFILLSASTAAISRVTLGVGAATAPRYILLQAVFLALLYILMLQTFPHKKNLILCLSLIVGSILYINRIQENYEANIRHQNKLREHMLAYYNDLEEIGTAFPPSDFARQFLNTAIDQAYFIPPTIEEMYPDIDEINLSIQEIHSDNMLYHIDKQKVYQNSIELKGWAFLKQNNKRYQKIIIGFKYGNRSYVFTTEKQLRPDVVRFYNDQNYDLSKYTGFNLVLDKKGIDPLESLTDLYIGIIQNKEIKSMISIDNPSTIELFKGNKQNK